jgi:hypothetical protein
VNPNDWFSLKTVINVPTEKIFFVVILKATYENSRSKIKIRNPVYVSKDPYPGPSTNATDPE